MAHLIFFVLTMLDGRLLLLTVLGCLGGAALVLATASQAALPVHGRVLRILLFGAAASALFWCVFIGALKAGFPKLGVDLPLPALAPALAASGLAACATEAIHAFSRRTVRTVMLMGSVFACGLSLMVFSGMAVLVRPFALAYDLQSVLAVIGLGATLAAFAFWEAGDRLHPRRMLLAIPLLAAALLVLSFGSLGSVLPFEQWIAASTRPDDLATSPIAIVLAAETGVGLLLVLSASLLDGLAAARDRREIQRVRHLADGSFEGILIHRDDQILDANARLLRMTGYDLNEIRQIDVHRLISDFGRADGGCDDGVADGNEAAPVETLIAGKDGGSLPVELLSRAIHYAGGPAQVTALRDIRDRREAEERIRHLAHHDALTDLPNRRHLEQALDQALRLARRTQAQIAVCCLDLDGFKAVNDTLGHAAGDLLLRQVAARMLDECRDSDVVARVGGDEFVVVLQTGADSERTAALAERLVHVLARPFELDGVVAHIGTSIGISFFPEDGKTTATLFKCADTALYRAKERGRGQFCLFEAGMDRAARERRELEHDLRAALSTEALSLHYQPLFDGGGEVIAFEALIRWQHPTRGAIPPDRFIPLAEQCGLILPIGEWVLRTACRTAASWPQNCRIAVNLSPAQFQRGRLPDLVATVLAESGLLPSRLELEVTEGVLIEDAGHALAMLNELRALGVRVVLDDFGTGYSSLGYLHSFPFDKVKIDRSFINRIETDRNAWTIVDAIIAMSHKLDLEVTAEGIETEAQLSMLTGQGCDEMQGYLLGRPMAEHLITGLVGRNSEPDLVG